VAYVLVILVAAAIGAGVYLSTLRQGPFAEEEAIAEPGPANRPDAGPAGGSYVPVVAAATTWESRLTSALTLVIAVIVGAVALAAGSYLTFAVAGRLLSHAAHG